MLVVATDEADGGGAGVRECREIDYVRIKWIDRLCRLVLKKQVNKNVCRDNITSGIDCVRYKT